MISCFSSRASWKQAVFRCKSIAQNFRRFVWSYRGMPWPYRRKVAAVCHPLHLLLTSQRWVKLDTICLILWNSDIAAHFSWFRCKFFTRVVVMIELDNNPFHWSKVKICAVQPGVQARTIDRSISVRFLISACRYLTFCNHFDQTERIFQFINSLDSRGGAPCLPQFKDQLLIFLHGRQQPGGRVKFSRTWTSDLY